MSTMRWMHRLASLAVVLVAGCPTDGNPHQLWLAEGASEANVRLTDSEPDPF